MKHGVVEVSMWLWVWESQLIAQKLFSWFGNSGVNGTGGYGKGSYDFGLF